MTKVANRSISVPQLNVVKEKQSKENSTGLPSNKNLAKVIFIRRNNNSFNAFDYIDVVDSSSSRQVQITEIV
jgi:hypothetical protein